jgi:hypothetical protein
MPALIWTTVPPAKSMAPKPKMRPVDEGQPQDGEQNDGRELDALGESADDQSRGNGRKGHLEADEDQFGNGRTLGEAFRHRGGIDARQEHLGETANEAVESTTIGKGKRVAVGDPQDHGDGGDHQDLHEDRQHVLGAHEATVEQRETGNDHQQNEDGGNQHPGGIALVDSHGRRSGGGSRCRILGEGYGRRQQGGRGGSQASVHGRKFGK